MTPAARKFLLPLHLWAGLTVGIMIVSQAISGSILDWRPQIEPLLNRHLLVVEPAGPRQSLDVLVARARAAHAASELDYVRTFADPTAPVLIRFTNKDFVHLNPYTGEVLGIRNRYGHFFGWLEGFHRFLMLDQKIGEPVIGSIALVAAFIVLTGLVMWWPATKRAFVEGLTLNRKLTGRAWTLGLHKTLGSYAALIVLTSALTGAPQALEWMKQGLYVVTGSTKEMPPPAPAKSVAAFIGMEAIAQRVQSLVPGAQETLIHFPAKGLVESFSIAADAPHPNARTYMWFDPANAQVVRVAPYAQSRAGSKLAYWALSIHMGMVGGVAAQLLLCCGALFVPVVACAGIASYFKRRAAKNARPTATATLTPLASTVR